MKKIFVILPNLCKMEKIIKQKQLFDSVGFRSRLTKASVSVIIWKTKFYFLYLLKSDQYRLIHLHTPLK